MKKEGEVEDVGVIEDEGH